MSDVSQPAFDFGADDAVADEPLDDAANPTYTVCELADEINRSFRRTFSDGVWVRGEIQQYQERGGHAYLTLADDTPGQKAVLRVQFFARARARLRPLLTQHRLRLAVGMKVRIFGRLELYAPSGSLGLTMTDLDPRFTLGDLAQQREQVLRRLVADGSVDANRRHPLSPVPLRIPPGTPLELRGSGAGRAGVQHRGEPVGERQHRRRRREHRQLAVRDRAGRAPAGERERTGGAAGEQVGGPAERDDRALRAGRRPTPTTCAGLRRGRGRGRAAGARSGGGRSTRRRRPVRPGPSPAGDPVAVGAVRGDPALAARSVAGGQADGVAEEEYLGVHRRGRASSTRRPWNEVTQMIQRSPGWWRTTRSPSSTRQPRLPVNVPVRAPRAGRRTGRPGFAAASADSAPS